MNKQQALDRLAAIESEVKELRKIIETPDKPTAKDWLINFLNENSGKFTMKLGEDRIVYFLDGQWIFDLDLKNKYLWCYYYKIWEVFYNEYSMGCNDVHELMKDVVLKPLNCEGFIPWFGMLSEHTRVLKPL